MNDLSRFEMHKKLKTWHFDLNRNQLDYQIDFFIEEPDEFWEEGIEEILRAESVDLNNGFFTKNEIVVKSVNDEAIKSFQNDVKNTKAPLKDNWFERRKLNQNNIFWKLTEYFNLDHIDMRMATQNPLDMTYRHIDHEHQQFISSKEGEDQQTDVVECFKSRGNWVKYIILLHDLRPGQVFYWGNSIIEAGRGAVITWDYATPHWTVNFSNFPRHSLMITGKKKS